MLANRIIMSPVAALSPLRRGVRNGKKIASRSVASSNQNSRYISSSMGGASNEGGNRRGKRARTVVGGLACALGVAAAFAQEGLMPEVFFDWDDQVEWDEVHHLAQMSNMTNKAPSVVRKWFGRHGYNGEVKIRDLPKVSSRYWIHTGNVVGEENNRVHHVAVRGTVSLSDLNTDFKTRLVMDEECNCRFHAGFKEVADAVMEDIEQFLQPGLPIKLCGHSMGGAVAVIVAMKLKARGYEVQKVMTFGAPKVTDAPGASRLRGLVPVLRITHETDPVPLMPLAPWAYAVSQSTNLIGDGSRSQKLIGNGLRSKDLTGDDLKLKNAIRGASNSSDPIGGDATPKTLIGDDVRNAPLQPPSSMSADSVDAVTAVGGFPGEIEGERWRERVGARGQLASSTAYSHFGSQVVLVRSRACLECRREGSVSPPAASSVNSDNLRRLSFPWDDIWGPDPEPSHVSGQDHALDDNHKQAQACGHCPSRGRTYYDPTGHDACVFDTAWLRFANFKFKHRMNTYELEIEDRRNHHFHMRDNHHLRDNSYLRDNSDLLASCDFGSSSSLEGTSTVSSVSD